ncbi:TPA: peptidylprolyl isomerase [Patescibacteria group bacterium]|nr:peptidylprolyl isomerase [Patescibacteria group bacterium]
MHLPKKNKLLLFVIPVFAIAVSITLLIFSKDSQEQNLNSVDIKGEETMINIDFVGLKTEIIIEGEGGKCQSGDEITVNYLGTLKDGTKFDSSYDREEPFTFVLGIGQVITGWDEGVNGMTIGEKRRIEIPSSMGYGKYGTGTIPPEAGLVFEVELLSIN